MKVSYELSTQNDGLRHVPNDAYFKAKSKLAKLLNKLSLSALKYLCAQCIIAEECTLGFKPRETIESLIASMENDKEACIHQLLNKYLLAEYLTYAFDKQKTKA